MTVRQLYSPAVAVLSLIGILVFSPRSAVAQINGPPASVTSPGFGGRPINGTPPSVTSLGPHGYAPGPSVPLRPTANETRTAGHRHHNGAYYGPYWYAVPVPYADGYYGPDNASDSSNANDDANYQGGPTVFDRRGSGASSYIPPVEDPPSPHDNGQDETASVSPDATPQRPTLLVFKDGHQMEVGNYAIVGATLFDLTPGHPRRIPLSDLDLDSTKKQNEDRGVSFDLPAPAQGN